MTDQPLIEETWVTTSEAAQITGYNRQYVIRIAQKMAQTPEAEREIKVRRRNGHELWLPDLVAYLKSPRRGPQPKRGKKK